jgi:hypothetical protein
MATTFTREQGGHFLIVTYAALGNETGASFEAHAFPDKTVTVYGTGTVTIEGSADGTNWVGLKDQTGTTISIVVAAAAASAYILENPRWMRAKNTSGTGAYISIVGCK